MQFLHVILQNTAIQATRRTHVQYINVYRYIKYMNIMLYDLKISIQLYIIYH